MRRRELVDERFDSYQLPHYDLLLLPSLQGVSIALHDAVRGQFVVYIDYPFPIVDSSVWHSALLGCLHEYQWLGGAFRSVRVGWRPRAFTLLPVEFYQPEEAKNHLATVARMDPLDVIYSSKMPSNAVLLFTVPGELINALPKLQSEYRLLPLELPFTRLAMDTVRRGSGLFLLAEEQSVSLILIREGQLLAVLPFQSRVPEDVLYRVLATLDAYKMTPSKTPFFVAGAGVTRDSQKLFDGEVELTAEEISALLRRYLPRLDYRPTFPYTFSYLLERVCEQESAFFSLLLCE